MAYIVKRLTEIYEEAPNETTEDDDVAKFLSITEEQGYRLVGVLPDHQIWDGEGGAAGKIGSMLILHKDGDA
jgi:hypothetical protein